MEESPQVSILVAARNEAANIERCLDALAKLSYPPEKLQILIGNDASEDNTLQLAEKFIESHPHFKVCNITTQQAFLRGKANVLAQLAHQATGDYFFYTDADVAVPEHWIEAMLSYFGPNVGVVTGVTTIEGGSIIAQLQAIEWLNSIGVIDCYARRNVPLTAMGNNMAVSKKAYWYTGGYETVGFSITEDFALFKAIIAQRFCFRQTFSLNTLAVSKPIVSLADLLKQRKRWMHGAMQLPLGLRIPLILYCFSLPLLLLITPFKPLLSLGLLLMLCLLHWLVSIWTLHRLKQKTSWHAIGVFPVYHICIYFVMLIHYFLPIKTYWKGRVY